MSATFRGTHAATHATVLPLDEQTPHKCTKKEAAHFMQARKASRCSRGPAQMIIFFCVPSRKCDRSSALGSCRERFLCCYRTHDDCLTRLKIMQTRMRMRQKCVFQLKHHPSYRQQLLLKYKTFNYRTYFLLKSKKR